MCEHAQKKRLRPFTQRFGDKTSSIHWRPYYNDFHCFVKQIQVTNCPKSAILSRYRLARPDILTGIYYTRKYGAMARRLGRPGIRPDQRRGFIIIQIDGLSYDHLRQAIAAGYLPYLGRLLAERRLVVSPWRCGLPSTTPAVQAGIMFGNRFDIPGFRWYDKERRLAVVAKRPDQIQAVRERISRGRPGILQGGSCYVNMLDGDADLALFTLSALHPQYFFENVRGMGLRTCVGWGCSFYFFSVHSACCACWD
jgi:hypothetical protein